MDQDAFRKLLSTSKQNGPQQATSKRSSILPPKTKDDQKKSAEGSKAAFKPRKVKKQTDSSYRDRAAERRIGAAGDFAEVESVLETFEKQHANEDKETVEEQRKYLGGDAQHTVLVKGLDFALLEQTKARMTASTSVQDDEELEDAFRSVVSTSPPPLAGAASSSKKRTREDILRELKSKRAKGESNGGPAPELIEDKALEEAKREGRFKPIGFKPIGGSSSKPKDGKEFKKKKKRKVVESEVNEVAQAPSTAVPRPAEEVKKKEVPNRSSTTQDPQKPPTGVPYPAPEPVDDDFDIFADAGEYEGINLDEEDEDDDAESNKGQNNVPEPASAINSAQADREASEPRPKRKWIDDDEPPSPPPERALPSLANSKGKRRESPPSPTNDIIKDQTEEADEDETQPERVSRLAPLASSAIPSIRDILEADSALEVKKKRKARKEKRKRGEGVGGDEKKAASTEAKINRDYQKLKSYTEKKGGGL